MPAHNPVVRYTLCPIRPAAHIFEASVTVEEPDPKGQRFFLPVWIPGSYLIREFARNVVSIRAESGDKLIDCEKIDKATWQCAPCEGPLTVTMEVYAWDLSVRGAHLDETHGFFNGTSVFLCAVGLEDVPCEVDIQLPGGERFANWQIATSLPRAGAPSRGFGRYRAANYDELIDHPVEMGTFAHTTFEAHGVKHHIAITGRTRADLDRLARDLKKICEHQISMFEPATHKAPMSEYWFLVTAVGDGYGGLEHRASTALMCARDDLPLAHQAKVGEGYRRFLGLASHEYFHSWNVKRIKPAAFAPYKLTEETYTRDLWFFEGFTSYYDDLALVRCGLIDELSYLELLAETIGRVSVGSARFKQSVAESSFDAWIKYYRADENAPNSLVSYYQKGSLIGFLLDATIRVRSGGLYSLDDVMRALWNEYGKPGIGVPEGGIEAMASKVAGLDLSDVFAAAVRGTSELDLAPRFKELAIDMKLREASMRKETDTVEASLGARIGSRNGDALLENVYDGGAAQAAGLSAGDAVIAVDGLRVNGATLDKRIRSYPVGSAVTLTVFRRDELMTFQVTLQPQEKNTCVLTSLNEPAEAVARRNAWLKNTVVPAQAGT
jgi:predicted metalloprotease with PDZ domain